MVLLDRVAIGWEAALGMHDYRTQMTQRSAPVAGCGAHLGGAHACSKCGGLRRCGRGRGKIRRRNERARARPAIARAGFRAAGGALQRHPMTAGRQTTWPTPRKSSHAVFPRHRRVRNAPAPTIPYRPQLRPLSAAELPTPPTRTMTTQL